MPLSPQHRALDRTLYKFDYDAHPLREHRLYAHATSDEVLRRVTSRRLVKFFEQYFSFTYFDYARREWRIRRLKGQEGGYYWHEATLRFSLRSPEIPFFGLTASARCPNVPFMYSSCPLGGEATGPRYFFNGEECFDEIEPALKAKFDALRLAGKGIIEAVDTLGPFT